MIKVLRADGSNLFASPPSTQQVKDWDESKHPRVPAGGPGGGQFGSGGGGGEAGDTSRDENGQWTGGPTIKYSDLPDDMQTLIFQFVTDHDDEAKIPDELPVSNIAVSTLPVVPLDENDRGSAHAREMDLKETPPILIANGHFLDGKHRVFQAREKGVKFLPAIDLTGIAHPQSVRENSMGKIKGGKGAKEVGDKALEWFIARAQAERLLRDWDESKHPRVPAGSPGGGQFGEGGGGGQQPSAAARVTHAKQVAYFNAIGSAPTTEGIEAAEENWRGGVADLGDPQAAIDVQAMDGYFDYRSHLEDAAREHLGDEFPVYRSISPEKLTAWKSGEDMPPAGVTLNPKFAENWGNFAGNTGKDRVVVQFNATPESIVMRGSREESEIVIDPNQISGDSLKVFAPGGSAAPKMTKGAGVSDAAFAKVNAAVAAIPASHAAQIAHVPVAMTKTSDEFPSHIAAGGGSSTVGLFSWTNNQPRIDIAEAIKVAATITEVGPKGTSQTQKTESFLPVRQPEQVTTHELAHAFDYVNDWKPSAGAALNQSFDAVKKQMTEQEAANARYWVNGGPREMFAELYSQIHTPNKSDDQTYFGGMSRQRVDQLFAPAIANILQIKRYNPIRRATEPQPPSGDTGWFVNSEGRLYALLGGMPYEVDVAGTPYANLHLVPGTYADDAALVAASGTKSLWQAARAQARKLLAKYNPNHEPGGSPTGGQFSSGTGSGGGGSEGASSGGKGGKKAKRDDFAKAEIRFNMPDPQVDDFIDRWNAKVGIEPEEFK